RGASLRRSSRLVRCLASFRALTRRSGCSFRCAYGARPGGFSARGLGPRALAAAALIPARFPTLRTRAECTRHDLPALKGRGTCTCPRAENPPGRAPWVGATRDSSDDQVATRDSDTHRTSRDERLTLLQLAIAPGRSRSVLTH